MAGHTAEPPETVDPGCKAGLMQADQAAQPCTQIKEIQINIQNNKTQRLNNNCS